MSNFSFRDLNLSGVEAQKGSNSLKPGRYVCTTSEAELKPTKSGGISLKIKLTDRDGGGSVTDFINIKVPNVNDDKQAMAQRIGRERLKALLVFGGHKNPDEPGDIKTMNGLTVGVIVEQGEDWKDESGTTRKGGGKPKKNGAYFDPKELGVQVSTTTSSSDTDLDDEIPF